MAHLIALPGIRSKITGGAMKRQRQVHRQLQAQEDGRRRWDRAYQLVVQWSEPPSVMKEETHDHANRSLCTSIDVRSGGGTKHRTADRALEEPCSRTGMAAGGLKRASR